MKIMCPENGCGKQFAKADIQKFGSKDMFEKYLRFKENIDVNINPNLRWCPKPDCNQYVSGSKKTKTI